MATQQGQGVLESVQKSMIKTRVQYKSKIEIKWISGKTVKDIEPTYVSNIIIDRDFDNANAPVIYMITNLPTTLCNKMINAQKTTGRIHLKVSHYNWNQIQ